MPWKAVGKKVHKLKVSGALGVVVSTHSSPDAAKRKVRALYASEKGAKSGRRYR